MAARPLRLFSLFVGATVPVARDFGFVRKYVRQKTWQSFLNAVQ